MRRARAISLLLLVSVLGCDQSPTQPDYSLDQLRAAPTQLAINHEQITVQAEVVRNLQPSNDPSASGIMVSVRLTPSAGASVTRAWVILDKDRWTDAAQLVPGTDQWVARGGPLWPVGAVTDVVVQLKDSKGGAPLVRVPGVTITAVF